MEPLVRVPPTREYHYKDDDVDMDFKVTVTLRASTMEKWIRDVKECYLNAAPIKCVGLDCEFTDAVKGRKQRDLPPEQR